MHHTCTSTSNGTYRKAGSLRVNDDRTCRPLCTRKVLRPASGFSGSYGQWWLGTQYPHSTDNLSSNAASPNAIKLSPKVALNLTIRHKCSVCFSYCTCRCPLAITLSPSLPKATLCIEPTFTRRKSGQLLTANIQGSKIPFSTTNIKALPVKYTPAPSSSSSSSSSSLGFNL